MKYDLIMKKMLDEESNKLKHLRFLSNDMRNTPSTKKYYDNEIKISEMKVRALSHYL